MKIDVSQQAANFSRKHSRMSKWRKVVTTMAIIVVFCTTYALILPAITMEKDATCGIELHEHTEACFAPAQAYLACEFVQADVDAAQIVIHTHDEFCYDADGNLLCTLEEVRAHRHTPDCYQTVENMNVEAHAHEEGCYQLQRGELICTETERDGHVHSDSCGCYIYSQALICDIEETAGHRHSAEAGCYQDTTVLVCTLAETAGHVHGESCRDAEGNIICTLAEVNAHAHGTDCYRTESNLVCTLQEAEAHSHGTDCYSTNAELVCELAEDAGHAHEDACYAWENVLICSQGASAAEEQILICDRSELGPHEHSAECSGPDGSLICGAAEAVAHQHDESCFAQPDPEAEPEVICGMEEHVHDDVLCYIDLTADLETRTQWEATLPDELSGDWHKDFLAVAKSQLGYRESDVNIVVDEDGVARGYTRYGAWYGAPYSDWCAMYVSFCLNYAEIPETEIPQRAACQRWIEVLCRDEYDLFRSTDEYMPVPGDIVFFDWEEDGHSDHVGIVYEILKEDGVAYGIRTIEGNSGNTVRYQTYKLDDPCLVGYAQLPEKPVEEPEADSDMAEEPAVESDTAEEQENSFEVGDDAENNSETDEETIIDPEAIEETENDSETDEEQINDSEVAEEMEGNPEVEGEAELAPEADGEIEADEEAELNPDAGEELVSDPEADVETAEQWEATLPDGLGGSWRDDLLAVAQSQVGYRESTLNFEVGEDGIARGYTRYGAWCGMLYADWSAMFASFCLNYAGVPDDVISGEIDCAQWVENLQQKEDGVFYAANEYIPVSGDLVFFDHDGDGIADHVGIISGVNEGTETEFGTLNAIEGDSEKSVREVNCSLNDAAIIGYAMLDEAEPAQPESDPEADIETAEQWEATLPGAPGGIWREDLLAVAYSQLGYSESTLNIETDEDGVVRGYTRYGAWYGDPYGDWNAMFVSFCLNYAGITRDSVPYDASCSGWIDALRNPDYDLYWSAGEYTPIPGDLIFFDLGEDGVADHVGIVAEVIPASGDNPAKIKTIEGDINNRVSEQRYDLNDSTILGYAELPTNRNGYNCGLREHTHDASCADENGGFVCGIEEHTHSIECTLPGELSEADRTAIAEVIRLIEPLPTYDEIMARLDEFYEADDTEGEEAYLTEIYTQVEVAYRAYMALDEEDREHVTNADKLLELEFIWSRITLEEPVQSYDLEGGEYYFPAADDDIPRFYQNSSYGVAYDTHAFVLIPSSELEDGEWTPDPIAWNGKVNANYIVTYCADDRTITSPSEQDKYNTYSIDNSRFTTDQQQRKIAAIIGNSYPFLTLEQAKAVMIAAGVEGAEQCTEHELITATQWAVWATVETVSHLEESDICDVKSSNFEKPTVNPLEPAAALDEATKTRIINVKNWLCSIEEPIRLAVTSYEPTITANEDGTFNLSLTVNLNRNIEPDEHAQFNLQAGSKSTTVTKLPAGQSSFVISAENLTEGELANAKVNLNISGEHMQAYFFDSQHYQDMVSGSWESYSDDLSFELGLELIDVAVTKVWTEENTAIESIDVQLLANGKPYGDPVTLSKANDWHYIWKDLKRYSVTEITKDPEDRTEIEYSIMEVPIPGYYSSDLTVDSFEGVEKVAQWQQVETFDGPGQYVFVSDTGALSAEYNSDPPSNWPGNHFIALAPVNLSSVSLTEERVIWNVAEYNGQYSIESVKYPGWYMNGSYERMYHGPSGLYFRDGLLGCGSYYFGGFYSNGYQYYTSNMDKVMYFRLYKLVELALPSAEKNFVLTNTLIPEEATVDVSVTKEWTGRPDRVYPESITVQLMQTDVFAGTEKPYGYPVVLNSGNGWTYTWSGMPEYVLKDNTNYPISYSVVEVDTPENYVPTLTTKEDGGYEFMLTNEWAPEKVSVELQKTGNNTAQLLPDAEFDLYLTTNQVGDTVPGTTDVKGLKIDHVATDATGKVTMNLVPGETYYLVETKEPEGYFLLDHPIGFTVTKTGAVVQLKLLEDYEDAEVENGTAPVLKIENQYGYVLPETGGTGTTPYTMAGMGLIIISMAYLMYKAKVRRREVA